MPKFAANLSMMFNEVPFIERFAAAANAGFTGVEYLFPDEFPASKNVTMGAWSRSPLPWFMSAMSICCAALVGGRLIVCPNQTTGGRQKWKDPGLERRLRLRMLNRLFRHNSHLEWSERYVWFQHSHATRNEMKR